jgi:hypothetical protein
MKDQGKLIGTLTSGSCSIMLMGSALLPFAMAALLILASSESFMPASSESTLDVVETVIAASPRIALNHPDPFRLGSKVSPGSGTGQCDSIQSYPAVSRYNPRLPPKG